MEKYKSFLQSDLFKNYKFNKNELSKIKVDINITNIYSKTYSTYSSVDWAKKQLSNYPEIRPLIHFLKRFLQINGLKSSYNGNLLDL